VRGRLGKSLLLCYLGLGSFAPPACAARISRGSLSPGSFSCGDTFTFLITSTEFLEDASPSKTCALSEFTVLDDLFAVPLSPGDVVTLEVKSPLDEWGFFPQYTTDGAELFATQIGACDASGLVHFTCEDFSNGTIFRNPIPATTGVTFFTDPGRLLFISVTNAAGVETVLYGKKPSIAPTSGTACDGAFYGTFEGDATVVSGQNCIFVSGGISGNLSVKGGHVELNSATVGKTLDIEGDATFLLAVATVTGNLNIHDLLPGSVGVHGRICGSTVHGNVKSSNNGAEFAIGDLPTVILYFCGPGFSSNKIDGGVEVLNNVGITDFGSATVGGNLNVLGNSAFSFFDSNKINESFVANANTGGIEILNNVISGNLSASGNAGLSLPFIRFNTIGGELDIINNSVSAQPNSVFDAFGNTISGNIVVESNVSIDIRKNVAGGSLICEGNSGISMGINSANQYVGQCGVHIVVTITGLFRDASKNIGVFVTLQNTGGPQINGAVITIAKIGSTRPASGLPMTPVNLASGSATLGTPLVFPSSLGSPGTPALLTIGGTYAGGSFNYTFRVTLP
jgi:hypothetical protein